MSTVDSILLRTICIENSAELKTGSGSAWKGSNSYRRKKGQQYFKYVVRMSSIMQLAVFLQDQLHKECYWVDSEGFLVELATMIYELWEIRIIEDMRCRQISN